MCSHSSLIQYALLRQQLRQYFPNTEIGYSDHTVPDSSFKVLFAAIVLGVTTIEKHYAYDKSLLGNDHYHTIDSGDLSPNRLFSFTRSILGESNLMIDLSSIPLYPMLGGALFHLQIF